MMKVTKINKMTAVVCAAVLMVVVRGGTAAEAKPSAPAAGPPIIKDFSSQGGHPRNKSDQRDTMYLVRAADKITFSVTVEGAQKYEWQVNKKVQEKAAADSLTWTVPDEKGIWEIHLKVSNKDGEAHREWAVSTLTKAEAPVLFDYFCPDRSQKDPWDRPLPKWDKDIKDPACVFQGGIRKPSRTAYGTWIFQRKYGPKGNRGAWSWTVSQSGGYRYQFAKPLSSGQIDCVVPSEYGTIPVHCMGRSAMGECCGTWADDTDDWREVRIVRTKDGWFYIWVGNLLWFDCLCNENTLKEFESLRLWCRSLDCVRVYDRTVWPAKSIRFGEYRDDFDYYGGKIDFREVKRTGIIIDGHGVRLKDIAKAIGDPKIFRYDQATRTATCYTDLVLTAGAELIIDGETLKMHCNKDGEHQIRVKNCSTIRLDKATVTSDNNYYYLWAFTSACKSERYYFKERERKLESYAARSFSGRFLAADSTISNCGNFFPDTPAELVLKRCKLLDLVEVDAGNYWKESGYYYAGKKRSVARGKKGLWFYNRKELVQFRIEDCTIHGKGKPIDITFIGGDTLHKPTISNSDLDNVVAKRGYFFRDWRWLMPFETEQMSSTVSLVNCKFRNLKARSSKAWIMPKYYLDVLAVDKAGRPMPGCKVRVINEVDDVRYPAENLAEKRAWVNRNTSHVRWIKVWLDDINDLRTPVPTGKDGHTAPPADKANTLVLTDFVQGEDERQEFTYTVQVIAPDGRFGERKGIDPGPDWYRKDPNRPAHTVRVVVDKPGKPAQPVRKPRPTVKTAKSPWPCFRGPDYAHTGRSPYVGPSKVRLLWMFKTKGEIVWSPSPAIGPDGTIYVCSDPPDGGLYAITHRGRLKWRLDPKKFWSMYFAPAIGPDGTIYAGYGLQAYRIRGKLIAISPKGKVKWEYRHPYGHQHCSPIPGHEGTVYYAAGGSVGAHRNHCYLYAVSPDGKLKRVSQIGQKMRKSAEGSMRSSPPLPLTERFTSEGGAAERALSTP